MALVLVVAMAWLLIKALKGFQTRQGQGNRIKLLLTLPVGSRERLVVVAYRECEYLVGITPGGISLLDKLPHIVRKESETDVNQVKELN